MPLHGARIIYVSFFLITTEARGSELISRPFDYSRNLADRLSVDAPIESGFQLPVQTARPGKWFDADAELEHLQDIGVRQRTMITAVASDDQVDTELQRLSDKAKSDLKQDLDRIDKLSREISHMNSRIQSQPTIQSFSINGGDVDLGYSLLEIETEPPLTLDDWAYCACNRTGLNGTLVFPDRAWPGIELPIPALPDDFKKTITDSKEGLSLLQVPLGSRRVSIRRSPECNCSNPWDSFNENPSTTCKVISGINVCLIRVNMEAHKTPGDSEYLKEQAELILGAIDKAVDENSSPPSMSGFIQTWNPFAHFQV
jgi:hypothetical protein